MLTVAAATPGPVARRALYQELRLALVFNGGVSLAVWMGGAAKEIDRFRRAFSTTPGNQATLAPYRELCDLLRTVVVTDVIAGASAGGINGAFLAYAIANGKSLECAGPNAIRELWQNLGSMNNLLSTSGKPESVLKTNEVLFAGCANVFNQLKSAASDVSDDVSRWVRLTITATDTHGYPVTAPVTAALDAEVAGVDHRLQFRFHRIVTPGSGDVLLSDALVDAIRQVVPAAGANGDGWPFPKDRSSRDLHDDADADRPAALLARAARTTSSFPIAFFASELPLNYTAEKAVSGSPGEELTATPPMAEVATTPTAAQPLLTDAHVQQPLPRWAIDGGVWDNSPFEAVRHAVEKTPSGRDVRRVLTYLVGTREPAPPTEPVAQTNPGLLHSLTKAIATPADLAFANDLARIRADCEQQHAHLDTVLRLLTSDQTDLHETARQLFSVYRAKADAARKAGKTSIAPELLQLDALPPQDADLAAWLATADTWGWGADTVRATVQRARRLLRSLLQAASAADVPDEDARALIHAREHLSQLAWALDDLASHAAASSDTAAFRRVCGEAMNDFASVAATVQQIAARILASQAATAQGSPLAKALHAAQRVTDGDAEAVIKRALALHVVLDALAGDPPHEVVDYSFTAIRPSVHWPDPAPPGVPDRPPLAGATFNHFGGFLRASWRLHDWMWGRIDGSHGIVNNLLTTEQLRRLTAGAADARALADGLAAFVIPDGPDAASLAAAALAAGGVAAATPADNGFDIASARAALAEHYRAAIASITANGDKEELGKLRRDVARRFRYAILRDEIPDLVTACAADGGRPPRADELLADPATALFRVPSDQLCRKPGRFELAEDGANAIANALYAFAGRGHSRVGRLAIGTAALSARGAARLTGAVRATGRAFGKARRSVGRSA